MTIIYRIPSFGAGMAPAYPMTALGQTPEEGAGVTYSLKNIDFGKIPGQIGKRPGTTKLYVPTGESIDGLFEFKRTDTGEKYLLAFNDGNMQYWDDGWTTAKSGLETGVKFECRTFANRVAVTNGIDDPFLWDGSSDDEPDQFPKAKFLAEFRLRLMAAGMPDEPLMLQSSHPGDPELWDPDEDGSAAFMAFVSPDDGQRITGLLGLDDFLLIGKEESLYGLFGTTRQDFSIFPVDFTTGVGSHWSMKAIMGAAFFVGGEGDIYRLLPGEPPTEISAPVRSLLEGADRENMDRARAFVYQNRYYVVGVPLLDNNRVTLVFDVREGRWAEWTIPTGEIAQATIDDNTRVVFTKPEGSQIWRLDKESSKDDDEPVESVVQTHTISFGAEGIEKDISNVFITFREHEDAIIYFSYRTDRKPEWSHEIPLNLQEGSGYVTFKVPIGETNCRELEFKLESVDATEFFLLNSRITYMMKEVE